MNDSDKNQRIAELNDELRQSLFYLPVDPRLGRVMMTRGIAALRLSQKALLLQKVAAFDTFTEENDPYGEHDFGRIVLEDGTVCYFKIDYYAKDLEHGSEDSSNPAVTTRVLTIMLESEY